VFQFLTHNVVSDDQIYACVSLRKIETAMKTKIKPFDYKKIIEMIVKTIKINNGKLSFGDPYSALNAKANAIILDSVVDNELDISAMAEFEPPKFEKENNTYYRKQTFEFENFEVVCLQNVEEVISAKIKNARGCCDVTAKINCLLAKKILLIDEDFRKIFFLHGKQPKETTLELTLKTRCPSAMCFNGGVLDVRNVDKIAFAWYGEVVSLEKENTGKDVTEIVQNLVDTLGNLFVDDSSGETFKEIFGAEASRKKNILVVHYAGKQTYTADLTSKTFREDLEAELSKERNKINDSASIIQRSWKKKNARKKEKAAVAIQCRWKGHKTRKELREKNSEKTNALETEA